MLTVTRMLVNLPGTKTDWQIEKHRYVTSLVLGEALKEVRRVADIGRRGDVGPAELYDRDPVNYEM